MKNIIQNRSGIGIFMEPFNFFDGFEHFPIAWKKLAIAHLQTHQHILSNNNQRIQTQTSLGIQPSMYGDLQ
jgi:hypothetical protein